MNENLINTPEHFRALKGADLGIIDHVGVSAQEFKNIFSAYLLTDTPLPLKYPKSISPSLSSLICSRFSEIKEIHLKISNLGSENIFNSIPNRIAKNVQEYTLFKICEIFKEESLLKVVIRLSEFQRELNGLYLSFCSSRYRPDSYRKLYKELSFSPLEHASMNEINEICDKLVGVAFRKEEIEPVILGLGIKVEKTEKGLEILDAPQFYKSVLTKLIYIRRNIMMLGNSDILDTFCDMKFDLSDSIDSLTTQCDQLTNKLNDYVERHVSEWRLKKTKKLITKWEENIANEVLRVQKLRKAIHESGEKFMSQLRYRKTLDFQMASRRLVNEALDGVNSRVCKQVQEQLRDFHQQSFQQLEESLAHLKSFVLSDRDADAFLSQEHNKKEIDMMLSEYSVLTGRNKLRLEFLEVQVEESLRNQLSSNNDFAPKFTFEYPTILENDHLQIKMKMLKAAINFQKNLTDRALNFQLFFKLKLMSFLSAWKNNLLGGNGELFDILSKLLLNKNGKINREAVKDFNFHFKQKVSKKFLELFTISFKPLERFPVNWPTNLNIFKLKGTLKFPLDHIFSDKILEGTGMIFEEILCIHRITNILTKSRIRLRDFPDRFSYILLALLQKSRTVMNRYSRYVFDYILRPSFAKIESAVKGMQEVETLLKLVRECVLNTLSNLFLISPEDRVRKFIHEFYAAVLDLGEIVKLHTSHFEVPISRSEKCVRKVDLAVEAFDDLLEKRESTMTFT